MQPKHIIIILLFFFFSFSSAATLTDNFQVNDGGWDTKDASRITYGTPISSTVLRIDKKDKKTKKTYKFGKSYANQTVTIEFDMWAVGGWENSGSYIDYFTVKANGDKLLDDVTIDGADGSTAVIHTFYSLTATLDSDGELKLEIQQDTSANGELAHLDNFNITATAPPLGCDNSLDIPQNSISPYTIVPDLHGATSAVNKCISGSTADSDGSPLKKDYYYFTVAVAGTLTVSATSPNGHRYYFRIGDTAGGTQYYGETRSTSHSDTITLSANDTVYVYVKESGNNDDHYEINFRFLPDSANAVDDSYNTAYQTPINNNVLTNDSGTGLQVLTGSIVNPSNGTLSMQANGDFTYTPNNGYSGPDTFSYTIQDSSGNQSSALVSITVASFPSANAADDSYTMTINTVLTDNLLTNDTGSGISITSNTNPSNGTVNVLPSGGFTYTPTNGFFGTDSFTYTITDSNGGTDTANVNITISNNTTYTNGFVNFHIVNPPSSRNVNGDFAVAGNTVTCLTARTSGYPGTTDLCHGNTDYQFETSNNRVNKYIDIDGDSSTWNSTSSNVNFPPLSYEPNTLNGVIWAGLFWQGRIAARSSGTSIRYAQVSGTGFNYTDIGTAAFTTANMQSTASNKLKLKIDSGPYNDVQAIEQLNYSSSNGVTYAAYADVTSFLRNANLGSGDHRFTVANLTTGEGRETSPGLFGGWSLVVIYAENSAEGHLRNVSVYHGLQSLGQNPNIEISGFRLPSEGDVSSQATVFSGEGEHLYGRNTSSSSYDWMKISDDNATFDYLPGPTAGTHVGNRDNMFNAQFSPTIDRDNIGDNKLLINNNGVDIDLFDVSTVMKGYRDLNKNLDTVFLQGSSNNDYVTPSMIAFSTELYRPNVCYDFAIDRNGFALSTINQDINTSALVGDEIGMTIAITSLESDFDLQNSAVSVNLNQTLGHVALDTSRAFYSPVNSNVLLDTPFTSLSTPLRPEIAIGKNRNELVGGLIGAYEQYFSKFYFDVTEANASRIYSTFDVQLTTAIDFGSGPVTQILPVPRCAQSLTYNPKWLAFNVERHTTSTPTITNNTDRYSLYTQIAGKDFDYSVVSYDPTASYSTESVISDITVDVELINADSFDDNGSALKCANPDPRIIHGGFGNSRFVTFNNQSRVPINDAVDFANTSASRSNVFRIWLLEDENGTIIEHTNARNEGNKFKTIYQNNYQNLDTSNRCTDACITNGVSGSTACYDCLRLNFAKAICSRDNFSIRPASYRLKVSDAGPQGSVGTPIKIIENIVAPANTDTFAAEYPYLLQGYATNNAGNQVTGYTRIESQFQSATLSNTAPELTDNTIDIALMQFVDSTSTCNDTTHRMHPLVFDSGVLRDYNLSGRNVGQYSFSIRDNGWTKVDQAENNPYKTLFDASCSGSSLPGCNDCGIGSGSNTLNTDNKFGCSTRSDLSDGTYEALNLAFKPYQFDLNSITFHTSPNEANGYLYMNDLNNNSQMAVKLEGNITAEGYNGNALSNFTSTCAASNVNLWIDRNMLPNETSITTEGVATPVYFQQGLKDNTATLSIIDNSSGTDMNSTLTASNFYSSIDRNGTATVDLYFNFTKPYNDTVNPIDVNITMLHAGSPIASSNANSLTNYVPDGNQTIIGGDRYFYFGRVTDAGADGQQIYDPSYSTSLSVQVYCDTSTTPAGMNCGLLPGLLAETGNWYRMATHTSASNDGQINSLSTTVSGVTLNGVSPLNNLTFDSNGSTAGVTIAYPLAGRPVHPVIVIDTDEWLKYSTTRADGKPTFTLHFLTQGLRWKGKGNTGNVIQTEPSNKSTQRLNW